MNRAMGPLLVGAALTAGVAALATHLVGSRSVEVLTDDAQVAIDVRIAQPRDIVWEPPTALGLDLPGGARAPAVSPDGLSVLFAAPGPGGDLDLFRADRDATGWTEPRRLAELSSADNESTPALGPGGSVWFASDRPGSVGGYDLWVQPAPGAVPVHAEEFVPGLAMTAGDEFNPAISPDGSLLVYVDAPIDTDTTGLRAIAIEGPERAGLEAAVRSDGSEASPAFSPAGDFLYFASDRDGGAGGLDLYRVRVRGGEAPVVDWLGEEVNSDSDERSPSLGLAGFRMWFERSSDEDRSFVGTTAREVYRSVQNSWTSLALARDLLRVLPWLLLALALVLLFAGLQRWVRSGQWEQRFSTLGLMARCVLASLALHAIAAFLLGLWNIHSDVPGAGGSTESKVRLTTSRAAAGAAAQLRAPAETPSLALEAPAAMPRTDVSSPQARPVMTERPATSMAQNRPTVRPSGQAPSPATPSPRPVAMQAPVTPASQMPVEMAAARVESSSSSIRPGSRSTAAPTPSSAAARTQSVEVSTTALASNQSASMLPVAAAGDAPSAEPSEAVAVEPAAVSAPRTAMPTERFAGSETTVESAAGGGSTLASPSVVPAPSVRGSIESVALEPAPRADDIGSPPSIGASATPLPSRTTVDSPTPGLAELALQSPAMPSDLPGEADSATRAAEEPSSSDARLGRVDGASPLPVGGLRPSMLDLPLEAVEREPPSQAAAVPSLEPAPIGGSPAAESVSVALLSPTLPTAVMPVARVISGVVLDDRTSEPIEGASVKLDGDGEATRFVETDNRGAFELIPPRLPDFAALTAAAEGYIPEAVNIAEEEVGDGIRVEFRLVPRSRTVVSFDAEPEVHHLGNDEFTGRINSQFQVASEGIVYEAFVNLDADQIPPAVDRAALRMLVRGAQNPNIITINGRELRARLEDSPSDGSFGEFIVEIPAGLLRQGRNALRIEAVARRNTDIDDFEFVNPELVLRPTGRAPPPPSDTL